MKIIAALALLILTSGCVPVPIATNSYQIEENRSIRDAENRAAELAKYLASGGSIEDAIAKAKELAAYDLKDPDSAKFREIKINEFNGGSVICGQINAKNSYGAYTGFKRFYASNRSAFVEMDETRGHPGGGQAPPPRASAPGPAAARRPGRGTPLPPRPASSSRIRQGHRHDKREPLH